MKVRGKKVHVAQWLANTRLSSFCLIIDDTGSNLVGVAFFSLKYNIKFNVLISYAIISGIDVFVWFHFQNIYFFADVIALCKQYQQMIIYSIIFVIMSINIISSALKYKYNWHYVIYVISKKRKEKNIAFQVFRTRDLLLVVQRLLPCAK